MTASSAPAQPAESDWKPELIEYPPVFVWPPRPLDALRFLWLLYRRREQGALYKFNDRWPAPRRRGRTFGNQTRENVFWALASGVTIWTGWEVVTLWLQASGRIPTMTWASNPVWFVALFPVVVLGREIHFFAIHRLIHWPPLYRRRPAGYQ